VPGPASVKVPAFIMVFGSIALSKVALTAWFSGTPGGVVPAPFTGFVRMIVGGVTSAVVPVVKVHGFGTGLTAARPLPEVSCAADVTCAVYPRLGRRLTLGLNDAVVPEYVTVPVTGVPVTVCFSVNAPVIVAEFIALLNVAVIVWLSGTPVAPLAGFVETIMGAGRFTVKVTALVVRP
jgi:hypothetical protein